MKTNAHGVYSELKEEKEFLQMTTKSPFVVVQFAHKDFKRCQIIDRHLSVCHPSLATIPLYIPFTSPSLFLQQLAQKHYGTKFAKVDVATAPFFVEKLKVQVLPCIICFMDGIAVDRFLYSPSQ